MHKEVYAEPAVTSSSAAQKPKAIIVRSEVMFGNIRIRCPNDLTEHEVPEGTKEFLCPVDGIVVIV